MAFVKGQSGNPGGKPKEIKEVVELARKHTSAAIMALVRISSSEDVPPAASVAASIALLDRAWGKPMQPSEISGKDGAALPTLSVTIARE